MKSKQIFFTIILICFCLMSESKCFGAGYFLNDAHSAFLQGKFATSVIFATISTSDDTGIPVRAGDMVQQRNTALLELKHNINPNISYFIQGRVFYDGVWDYGPSVFSNKETRATYFYNNNDEIKNDKWNPSLFLGYVDFKYGNFFARIGRQAFAWGLASVFRVVDQVNPLDNQSLGISLEEKRIPLDTARLTYIWRDLGFLKQLSLDGYYIPGKLDDRSGERVPAGNANTAPSGRYTTGIGAGLSREIEHDSDRYGAKLGLSTLDMNYSFVYSSIYSDPGIQTAIDNSYINVIKTDVNLYGFTFDGFVDSLNGVLRGEFAYMEGQPYMVDKIKGTGAGNYYPDFPLFDTLNWVIGFEKTLPIEWINSTAGCNVILEYEGSEILGYQDNIWYGFHDPKSKDQLYLDQFRNLFLFNINSSYFNDKFRAGLTAIYIAESSTLMSIPSLKYTFANSNTVELQYTHTISQSYKGMGLMQDLNQLALYATILF